MYATCDPESRVCVCPSVDDYEKVHDPVCGSNGFTYNNEMELQDYACHNELVLVVVKKGKCSSMQFDISNDFYVNIAVLLLYYE